MLNPHAIRICDVSALLAMDRTTLTANLKPLERRGLVRVRVDPQDKCGRRLSLTTAGSALLAKAVPVWRATHDEIDDALPRGGPDRLRRNLTALGAIAKEKLPKGEVAGGFAHVSPPQFAPDTRRRIDHTRADLEL